MASQYFLLLNGIAGDSKDARHHGWFTLDSLQMEGNASAAMIGGRSAHAPAVNNITVVVESGPSTAQLLAAVQQRKSVASGQIQIVAAHGAPITHNLANIVLLSARAGAMGRNAASIHVSMQCRMH